MCPFEELIHWQPKTRVAHEVLSTIVTCMPLLFRYHCLVDQVLYKAPNAFGIRPPSPAWVRLDARVYAA